MQSFSSLHLSDADIQLPLSQRNCPVAQAARNKIYKMYNTHIVWAESDSILLLTLCGRSHTIYYYFCVGGVIHYIITHAVWAESYIILILTLCGRSHTIYYYSRCVGGVRHYIITHAVWAESYNILLLLCGQSHTLYYYSRCMGGVIHYIITHAVWAESYNILLLTLCGRSQTIYYYSRCMGGVRHYIITHAVWAESDIILLLTLYGRSQAERLIRVIYTITLSITDACHLYTFLPIHAMKLIQALTACKKNVNDIVYDSIICIGNHIII